MRTFVLYCILLLVTVLGCTKAGKNISITGIVRNPVTGQPYADVQIKLLRTDGGLPGGLKDVETAYTNSDGYFEIHHYGAYKHYELGAYPDTETKYIVGWFEDGVHVGNGRMNVEKGQYMNPVFEMVEYGFLKVNIHNLTCEGASDLIVLERNYRHHPSNKVFQPITLNGCYDADGAPAEVPMGYYDLKWTVTKPSFGTQIFTDEVFVPANGIGEFTINY